jgi:hypothetical protein
VISKFNHGPFSKEVDEVIKNLSVHKSIKNKVQKTFDDLFRNIDIPNVTLVKLKKLAVEEEDLKDIKNLIKKNEKAKLK